MRKKVKIIIIALLVIITGSYLAINFLPHNHKTEKIEQKQLYTCPMHPQIVRDEPGDCPICGMKLVPVAKEEKPKEKKIRYRSTMNPGETSDKPGKDSMGMDMVPFESGGEDEVATPEGLAPVTVPKEKREMIGISFEKVMKRDLKKLIDTSVRIVPDETRQYKVTTKVGGWVEKLFVNQTGQFVKKGSPLLSIYSPELLSAQQEYLSAVKAKKKLSEQKDAEASSDISDSMEEIETAAHDRLMLFDLSEEQIDQIRKSGKIERNVTLFAPASGYVSEKMVFEGQKIMMNDSLMTIIDLSRVWGEIDLHETDQPFIREGMDVLVTIPYWQDKTFKGKVSFINPFIDPDTRVLKARVEIPNSGVTLKPNMYANARLTYNFGKKLSISDHAVMQTGDRNYVFIEGKNDMIIPYEIKLGIRSGDGYYEVIAGLKGGERVVASANFLIDSESSLKAAFKDAAKPSGMESHYPDSVNKKDDQDHSSSVHKH